MPSTWDAYVAGSPLGQTLDSPYYKGTGTAWGNTIVVSSGRRALPSWIIWLQAYQTFYVGDDPFATFAVSFGYPINPANADQRRVENIWANGRLIWSGSATSSGDGADIDWTFYPGSEAQGQDPLMAADLAESADTTPAYRGQMIMVLANFPLSDFENAIPSITAEIVDYPAPVLDGGEATDRERMVDQLALFTDFTGSLDTGDDLAIDGALFSLVNDGTILAANWALVDVFTNYGQFYGFDFCESAGVIRFFRPVNEGAYSLAAAITESDAIDDGSSSGEGCLLTTRADAGSIPTLLTLTYIDASQEYQTAIQRARRTQFPQRSVLAESAQTLEVPLIVDASEALTGATKALYRYAHQSLSHQFTLPPKWLALEPGDVISLAVRGKTYVAQITYAEIQPDFSIKITAKNIGYGPDYSQIGFGSPSAATALRTVTADRLFNLSVAFGVTIGTA